MEKEVKSENYKPLMNDHQVLSCQELMEARLLSLYALENALAPILCL